MIALGLYNYTNRDVYRVAGVSEQAVSQHKNRRHLKIEQMLLISQLVVEYRKLHPGCGMRKLYHQIQPTRMGRDKFIDLLIDLGYKLPKPQKIYGLTIPGSIKWPNLIEGMLLFRKDQVWQSDITYFTIHGIHYYLIFIIDVYTKLIISHEVSQTMHAIHNVRCLKRALRIRGIKNDCGLFHHSDRGSQYTSLEYIDILNRKGIHKSMGSKGQENAYAERVNGTIKNEYLNHRSINSFSELKLWTKQAVNNYNSMRIHDALPGKISPLEFEKQLVHLSYQRRPKAIIYADGNYAIREDFVFLNRIPKKALRTPICPIKLEY